MSRLIGYERVFLNNIIRDLKVEVKIVGRRNDVNLDVLKRLKIANEKKEYKDSRTKPHRAFAINNAMNRLLGKDAKPFRYKEEKGRYSLEIGENRHFFETLQRNRPLVYRFCKLHGKGNFAKGWRLFQKYCDKVADYILEEDFKYEKRNDFIRKAYGDLSTTSLRAKSRVIERLEESIPYKGRTNGFMIDMYRRVRRCNG